MAKLIEEVNLVKSEIGENANKWWRGQLFDDDKVKAFWGRVGASGENGEWDGGKRYLDKKVKEKIKKGYTHAKTVTSTMTQSAGVTSSLQLLAQQELAKNNPTLSKLIDRLVASNIHNITSNTNITFNSANGLFQTPLGIVTPAGVTEARDMLVEVKKALEKRNKKSLVKLTSEYVRIIPQKVGRIFTIESVFPDIDSIQKQSDILDSLEASYKSLTANTGTTSSSKVFEVELDVLMDNNEIRRLTDEFEKTKSVQHGYNHIKIQNIYTVQINDMFDAFSTKGKPLGSIKEVYHGTSQANVLSILKSGLKTAPPSTAYIAGKMFGNGIYGAIQSSKSLGYTFGRWGASSADTGWLFICDFAMGKIDEPTGHCSRPSAGYDSVWAKAKKCNLYHDELIVYRNEQVNVKYLIECK